MAEDYNDGEWHMHVGEDCPVHPKSSVDFLWQSHKGFEKGRLGNNEAKSVPWGGNQYGKVVAFRVAQAYKKRREFWIVQGQDCIATFHNEDAARLAREDLPSAVVIHVREVTP